MTLLDSWCVTWANFSHLPEFNAHVEVMPPEYSQTACCKKMRIARPAVGLQVRYYI